MAQERVRLGVVGAGNFSRRRLLPNFQQVPGVELAAVCNSREESSQQVAEEFGFQKVYADWRDLVASPEVDAVFIGTRPSLHASITVAALDAGKHVLTMNALASSVEEGQQMAQKAKEHPDLVALVFPTSVHQPHDALVRELLQAGYIGRVQHVLFSWNRPMFDLGRYYEVGRRWLGGHTRLFAYRKRLDMEMAGSYGGTTRPFYDVVLAELESGGTIQYLHSPSLLPGSLNRVEIYGTEGALVCYEEGQEREGVYGGRASDGAVRQLTAPPHTRGNWEGPAEIPVERDFIEAVRSGRKPSPAIPTFDGGVAVLRIADVWRESMEQGAWVEVPKD